MKLVVVESPAKAKTINKYLGKDYKVLASYGHIRDLPSKDGSVDPEKDFSMVWELSSGGKKRLNDIITALKDCDTLVLASDPDREGEAIAWHILEELSAKKKLKDKKNRASRFPRNYQTRCYRSYSKSAPDRRQSCFGIYGSPCFGLSGGVHAFSGPLA